MENAKNIVMFKLINSEVVMGEAPLPEDNDTEVVVLKPMQLLLDPVQGGVGMIPYDAVYTQEEPKEFTFKTKHIMHFMPVHESFKDAYVERVTGIATPQTPKIEV